MINREREEEKKNRVRGDNSFYLLAIYMILSKYSHSERPLTVQEIKKGLVMELQLEKTLDTRTIKNHLSRLFELSERGKLEKELIACENGYYLLSEMDITEVRLLSDIVASSKYITSKQSMDLIKTLYFSIGMKIPQFYYDPLKYKDMINNVPNPEVFLTVEILSEAIRKNRQVNYSYLQYNHEQELVLRGEKERTVSVYDIIWTSNHYYALCYSYKYDNIFFLRIDRMTNVRLSDKELEELPKKINLQEYVSTQPHMFGGDIKTIRFEITPLILDQVIDSFGQLINIQKSEEGYIIEVESSYEVMHVWLIQYCQGVKRIHDSTLRKMVKESLEKVLVNLKEN